MTLGFDSARLTRIDDYFNRQYIDTGRIAGCQLAIRRGGHTAYFKSFGLADRERGVPIKDDTIFRIYSMTKPITSIGLMMLVERGLVQLSDPVARFFPSWTHQKVWMSGSGEQMETEAPKRLVTIKDVLSHQAGLSYGGGLPNSVPHPVDLAYRTEKIRVLDAPDDLGEFMTRMSRIPLRYQPGTAWMYSVATDVCGALIERISGQSLDHYFEQEIFQPLGMSDTAFSVAPDKAHRFAANYERGPDKALKLYDDPATSTYLKPPIFRSGGGGLTSTSADYLKFCDMVRARGKGPHGRVIGARTLDLMAANHLPDGRDLASVALDGFSETTGPGVGFGLGFASTIDGPAAGSPSQGDLYWGGLASTIFWVDPRDDLSVVFMTQFTPSGTYNFRGQLRALIYGALD